MFSKISRAIPLALIVVLFFFWGMANNLNDVLVAQFKKVFTLSDLQAGLVQSAFYLGYFLFALPAGIFMRRYGYKNAILVGLLLYGMGAILFWPAANLRTYGFFLFALFVIASGLAFLETSANPFVTVMGPQDSAAWRLNLAQAFNPLGSITGILIGQRFIFSGIDYTPTQLALMSQAQRGTYLNTEAMSVQVPYLMIALAVLVWAALIFVTRFPSAIESKEGELKHATSGHGHILQNLWKDKSFRFALVAQFFYVGAQVGIWSYLIRYVQFTMPGTSNRQAANFLTASLICFMVGRFAGTSMLKRISAARLLGAYAVINVLLMIVAIFASGIVGACALVVCSLFMSVMYPTIFALGVEGKNGDERKIGSSMLVMTIIGGAVLTAIVGRVSDHFGIPVAMSVPCVSFLVVWLYARYHDRLIFLSQRV
jgi:FHS family L-fucose permease-like MFS transporter